MADENSQRGAGHAMFGLNDSTPAGGAAATPGAPPPVYVQMPPSQGGFSGSQVVILIAVVLLLIGTGVNLYLIMGAKKQFTEHTAKQADQLDLLTRRVDSSDERYAQLRGQVQVMGEKQGLTEQELAKARGLAANLQKQQQASVKQLNDAISRKAGTEEVNKLQEDANAKFGTMGGDIAGTKADLEATKQALAGTKGDLTSAIARTHDELVALAHRSDRDYFEFNLAKKNTKQKLGTVTVELTKTNPKKNQFTINLYFDDKKTERRDKSINEPLYFYVQGAPSALELVVNKLGKESIAGYVSTPKGFFAGAPTVLTGRPGS